MRRVQLLSQRTTTFINRMLAAVDVIFGVQLLKILTLTQHFPRRAYFFFFVFNQHSSTIIIFLLLLLLLSLYVFLCILLS